MNVTRMAGLCLVLAACGGETPATSGATADGTATSDTAPAGDGAAT